MRIDYFYNAVMDVSSFNLRHLRGFVAISATGSITEAAAQVAMSQPALSQAVAKLERRLDHDLFDRRMSGLFLTEAGAIFAARVREGLDNLSDGVRMAVQRARRSGMKAVPFDTLITMTQLRALLAVADARNYTVAAEQAGLTQPSIHKSAKDLEHVAGFDLYVRTPQGIDLTRPAQELADRTSLMFAALRNGVEELQNLADADSGQVVVGTLPLARSHMLPNAINTLLQKRPKVTVKVHDGLYSDLLRSLRIGELDLIIGALRDNLQVDDVEQHLLFKDPLAIIAGPEHPLASATELTWRDLTDFTWVVPRLGTPTRHYFDQQMSRVTNPDDIHVIETSSLVMIRELLVESDRLAISSAHQIEREERLGILSRLDFDLHGMSRRIGLTTRAGWNPTKSQAAFFEILKDEGLRSAAAIDTLLNK